MRKLIFFLGCTAAVVAGVVFTTSGVSADPSVPQQGNTIDVSGVAQLPPVPTQVGTEQLPCIEADVDLSTGRNLTEPRPCTGYVISLAEVQSSAERPSS